MTTTVITNMPMYRAIIMKAAIKMHLEHGIQANRAYTPANMLRAAGSITGKTYNRGQLKQAFIDLGSWLEVKRLIGETLQDERPFR
jgi:hypothetical protein